MAHQGRFKPLNPHKYKGNPVNIIYRSSWELKLFRKLDGDPAVKWWQSEEVIVPYISPIDNRSHRYYPDVVFENVNGEVFMIEIKPMSQSIAPQKRDKVTKKYINEVFTYGKNQAKWEAAKKFCEKRGWKFVVMTEKELGIK